MGCQRHTNIDSRNTEKRENKIQSSPREEREKQKKKNDKKKKRKGNKFQLKLEVNWAFVAKHGPIIT